MNKIKTIVIVDYGMGNLYSVRNALYKLCGYKIEITSDKDLIRSANGIVIPGVGAFKKAMQNLTNLDLIDVLSEQAFKYKTPILGVCLGMQLLFDFSFEKGSHKGLSWIPGNVHFIKTNNNLRIPHVGWNNVTPRINSKLFKNIKI